VQTGSLKEKGYCADRKLKRENVDQPENPVRRKCC
jgi:hypothetical protein